MIEREERDGIVTLRLAHGKANAMDLELCRGIIDALHDAGSCRRGERDHACPRGGGDGGEGTRVVHARRAGQELRQRGPRDRWSARGRRM